MCYTNFVLNYFAYVYEVIYMSSLLNIFDGFGEKFRAVFRSFGPRDAVDIILLSLVLILAFTILKGKKGRALLVGIVISVAALAIANIFNFTALGTIFSGIVEGGSLVVIILFQPEIREALERLGSGSINSVLSFHERKKKKELYYTVIDNICDAVAEMSIECTGALIVIERSMVLSDITKGGVKINADVSSLLLRNLFYNRAPLHDGAVVISEGRITAAACFLPLTKRIDLDSSLGTRHRAALGLSEITDAIVIVVSEETGRVSVAYEGELMRGLGGEELKNYLLENLLKITLNSTGK